MPTVNRAQYTSILADEDYKSALANADAAQRGVGTGACGPDTMEAYRVRPGVYDMQLVIW